MTTFGGTGAGAAAPLKENEVRTGGKGNDTLDGGGGADTLNGGLGADILFGDAGNDLFIWNAGGGNDVIDGGADVDTFRVEGSKSAEIFLVFERAVDLFGTGDHLLIENIEKIELNPGAGDDEVSATNVGDKTLVVDMGSGNDTVAGSKGADTINGGVGDDLIKGRPGSGSDQVIGGRGFDTFSFDTASNFSVSGSDIFTLSAKSGHALLNYNVEATTQDLEGVERIVVSPREASDVVIIQDLAGAGVTEVHVDLGVESPVTFATIPDFARDTVEVFGNAAGGNHIDVAFEAGVGFAVTGLSAKVLITGFDGNSVLRDSLFVFGGEGADTISAATSGSGLQLVFEGGAGNDSLVGSGGGDILAGRNGSDTLSGGPGGGDTFFFAAGETGSDLVLDFSPHSRITENGDSVFLEGFADFSLADLINHQHIVQSGADVVVSDGAHVIVTLANISLTDLGSSDFLFPGSPTLPPPGPTI